MNNLQTNYQFVCNYQTSCRVTWSFSFLMSFFYSSLCFFLTDFPLTFGFVVKLPVARCTA